MSRERGEAGPRSPQEMELEALARAFGHIVLELSPAQLKELSELALELDDAKLQVDQAFNACRRFLIDAKRGLPAPAAAPRAARRRVKKATAKASK